MSPRTNNATTSDRTRSELALLVEAEARLDRALADAHHEAAALEEATRERIARADAEIDAKLGEICATTRAEVERTTAAAIQAIELASQGAIGRYETVRDDRADAIARELAEQLVALVAAEVTP